MNQKKVNKRLWSRAHHVEIFDIVFLLFGVADIDSQHSTIIVVANRYGPSSCHLEFTCDKELSKNTK